jgi:hypothetical protein
MTASWTSNVGLPSRSKEVYQYQPLAPEHNEIRLLKIYPPHRSRRHGEPIECSILTTSLEDAPSYKALSYTWGTELDIEQIFLDECPFNITSTLQEALLQLRSNRVKIIWIDALCINQTDFEERSEQVSKMRTIYERAEEVLVWLGPSTDDAPLAFDIFEVLHQHRLSKKDVDVILKAEKSVKSLAAVRDLFQRNYWYRLWVVQEINSAKKITLLSGSCNIDWQKLKAVQNMLISDHSSALLRLSTNEALDRLDSEVIFGGPRSVELPPSDSPSSPPHLYTLLCRYWLQKSSDPRDKIYALVGLSMARDDPNFVIDYSASIRQVYISAAKYIIISSQSLDGIFSTKRGIDQFGLPSWVPDWNVEGRKFGHPVTVINDANEGPPFKASGSSTAEFGLESGDQILIANGLVLSRILATGQHANFESSSNFGAGIPMVLRWYRLCNIIHAPPSVRMDSFCRTIYYDRFSPEDFRYSTTLELMERLLAAIVMLATELCPEERVDPQLIALRGKYNIENWWAKSWTGGACATLRGRRFFTSDSELMGMGPALTEAGDIICILLGCSTPVILRPQDDHYIFLGEAYFHGYMYGKAMEELAEGKFQLESFEIH